MSSVQKKWVKQYGYPTRIRIRLIKVELPDGKLEVLGTSLLCSSDYPTAEFGAVNRLRWRVETYLDRLKNIFELQRLGGKSSVTVEQDFYSLVFLANLESILTHEAELEIRFESQRRGRRYDYQVVLPTPNLLASSFINNKDWVLSQPSHYIRVSLFQPIN
jgi:hypothetical protein